MNHSARVEELAEALRRQWIASLRGNNTAPLCLLYVCVGIALRAIRHGALEVE